MAAATRTQTQQPQSHSPFEAAIDRATRAGLQVVGVGRFKADGRRFYLVPSQREPLRNHVVRLVGHSLVCDCQAAAHGQICAHRASVHMYLTVAAERRRAHAEVGEHLLRAEAGAAAAEAEGDEDEQDELRSEPGWVPTMAPGPDPDEAFEDDAEADRERWRAMNLDGAMLDCLRGWC